MSVSEYNNIECKYKIEKLDKTVYLIDENTAKNIHIDSGAAYATNIQQSFLELDVYNISFEDTEEIDERYKFTHTLTFSMNGYANYNVFQGRFYVIVKTVDGDFWLVNPFFPCKVTYTYTLDGNGSHTDFTLATVSNFPALRIIGMSGSTHYDCGYEYSILKNIKINETAYSLKTNNVITYTNDGFKTINYKKNTAVFTEQFDGDNVQHSLSFQIDFDSYKSSWHYNLLEFYENKYALVIQTSDNKFISTGFGFGLNPSFTVAANDEFSNPSNIQIVLGDKHNDGNLIGYDDELFISKDGSKSWRYTSRYNGYECVSDYSAKYLLQEEVDAFGNPTGYFKVLRGYQSQFPNLNIVGVFDEIVTFFSYECSPECEFQSSFPIEFKFESIACREYNVICNSNWSIGSSSNYITVSPSSGAANQEYVVRVCNTQQPTSAESRSTLTIHSCGGERTIDVVVKNGDGCFPAGSVFDISANGQYVTIPTSCNVMNVVDESGIITTKIIQNNSIRVYVPENQSGLQRQISLAVTMRDLRTIYVVINQNNGYERWVAESFGCHNNQKCTIERKYTGTSISDINAWTSQIRYTNCQEDSICGGIVTRWIDTSETTCNGGKKYVVQAEQSSTDNGANWTDTGNKRLGGETQDSPAECEGTDVEEKWEVDTNEYFCDNATKYTLERLYVRQYGSSDWVITDITRKGETVLEENSYDCGYFTPTSQWSCQKWETAEGYICDSGNKYVKEQLYVRNCADCNNCNEQWLATDIYRRSETVLEENSYDCGYIKGTSLYNCSEWRILPNEYVCEGTTKYTKERLYQSDCQNCGSCSSWVATDIYRKGVDVIENNSTVCGYIIGSSEWSCEKWEIDNEYYICEETTKFKAEQRYVRNCSNCNDCNAQWLATGVYRKTNIVLETNSTDCGYFTPTNQWTCEKWEITDEYVCEETTKYAKERRYVRNCTNCNNCNEQWVATDIFRRSQTVLGVNSYDCGYNPNVSGNCVKWENEGDTICDGYSEYEYLRKYVRNCVNCNNCSELWIPTDIYKKGDKITNNCVSCGYIPSQTYSRWLDESTICEGFDEYEYLRKDVSEDGSQWYSTSIYKRGELIENNSFYCGYIPTENTAYTQWRVYSYMCNGGNKYTRLRKYISEDGSKFYATYIYKQGSLVEQNSIECGYVPNALYVKWSDFDTMCDGFDKYEYLRKSISEDNINWYQTSIYKQGDLIERNSFDCGYLPVYNCYGWSVDGTMCNGYGLYERLNKRISDDCNERWYTSNIYALGNLIEENSTQCGYVPKVQYEYRWLQTETTHCNGVDLVYYYKQQKKRMDYLDAQWEDVIPTVYSIDGDGTMPIIYALRNAPQCGYVPPVEPQYKWVVIPITTDYICEGNSKYYKEQKYVTYDNGQTWQPLSEYKKGELYEASSSDCGVVQYRWVDVSNQWTCSGCTKYQKTKKQVSNDGGTTWQDVVPTEYGIGSVIEQSSTDCGCGTQYRWFRLPSTQYICEGTTKYYKEVYQVSYDGGNTWADVVPTQTRANGIIEEHSLDCGSQGTIERWIDGTLCDDCVTYKAINRTDSNPIYIPCDSNSAITSGEVSSKTSITSTTIGKCVSEIGFGAFSGCTYLKYAMIPSTVRRISERAFVGCQDMVQLTIPEGVESIGSSVFSGCTNLNEIVLPETLTTLDRYALRRCGLKKINIPSSLSAISENCFNSCTDIEEITIPNNITRIEYSAFIYCTSLNKVTVLASTPPSLGNNAFFNTSEDLRIYVPEESLNAYKTAYNWSEYSTKIYPIQN